MAGNLLTDKWLAQPLVWHSTGRGISKSMAHSMQNIPRATVHDYDINNVLSCRPDDWNLDAEITTAILRGAGAHANRRADGSYSGHYLIQVPGHLVQYLNHMPPEIRVHILDSDSQDVYPTYWPEIPFAEVPRDVLDLLMLTYIQFGYVR